MIMALINLIISAIGIVGIILLGIFTGYALIKYIIGEK
jgi:ABC-type glycerol-3-phosphate transport system permease component